MDARDRKMILTLFMAPTGYHKDSWRRPGSRSEELGEFSLIRDMVQAAENAKIHACFFADILSVSPVMDGNLKFQGLYEPITSLAALAAQTERIGLIGSASTSFYEPYNLSRLISGVDHLSGGRAGWNIVTSWIGNENFGLAELPGPEERYRRATEFVEVANKLWDSWGDDAVINDREAGWWADPKKITPIQHEGEFFGVNEALNMNRSPQGRPVLVQAGSSRPGLELGSSVADAIYTVQSVKESAVEFYKHFKGLVAGKGRDPEQVHVLPGVLPIIGDSDKEAQDIANELANYVNIDHGRAWLSNQLKIDVQDIDPDEQVPAERFVDDGSHNSRWHLYRRLAVDEKLSLRELILEDARAGGHMWLTGTASTVADRLIDWFDSRACDGFSLNPSHVPEGMQAMFDKLVPELQNRGYFHEDYAGRTLRENMGIDRPQA